jgi:hypothetical protein
MVGEMRKAGFLWGFFLSFLITPLVGLLLVFLYGPKEKISNKYLPAMEEGDRYLFKKDNQSAWDNYMDALFYLNREGKKKGKKEKKRQEHLLYVEGKLNELT